MENVYLFDDRIAVHDGRVIIDHLTGFYISETGHPSLKESSTSWIEAHKENLFAPQSDVIDVQEPVLIVNNEGGGTWGHWLIQNLSRVVLFNRIFPRARVALPQGYLGRENNFGLSLHLFGIERNRIFPTQREKVYRFRNAIFIDALYHDGAVHPEVLRIFDAADVPAYSGAQRVLAVRTGNDSSRNIENLPSVIEAASSFGFTALSVGTQTAASQASVWRHSTHIMGTLGSDLTGLMFARSGTQVIVLTPDFHGDSFFFDIAAAKGVVWNELVSGRIGKERAPHRNSSFVVGVSELTDLLSEALNIS